MLAFTAACIAAAGYLQITIASPINHSTTNYTTSLEGRGLDISHGGTISVRDCVMRGKPWGFVCCAHSWGLYGMHCQFLSGPGLQLPVVGECERSPDRYNHGPYCAREEANKDGTGKETGLFLKSQVFDTTGLSDSSDNWGRFSPEGKRVLDMAMNGGLEFEPTDLSGRDHKRGNMYPDLFHVSRKHNTLPEQNSRAEEKFLESKTDAEKDCYHECRFTTDTQYGQERCVHYCWAYANDVEAYKGEHGQLKGWTAWERSCFVGCMDLFPGDNQGQLACEARCKDDGIPKILSNRPLLLPDGQYRP